MMRHRPNGLSVRQRLSRLLEISAASTGGAIGGAVIAHFLDPDRGHARRTRLRDETLASLRRLGRMSHRTANDEARHATDRFLGMAHVSARRLRVRHDDLDDVTLAQKVRSEALGPLHHSSISVDSAKGVVHLRGEVGSTEEITRLIEATKHVRGVKRVTSYLHLPGEVPSNKEAVLRVDETGDRRRPSVAGNNSAETRS